MSYYPVLLNILGRRCVVIGGGKVALRKVRSLLKYGGSVMVISPQLCPELEKLVDSGDIEIVRRVYEAGDLAGAFLAVASSDDAFVNQTVASEAGSKGVLVNVADDTTASDFIVPSHTNIGDITLAVATGAQSPILARKIRMKLESELGEEYSRLLQLVSEVRREMLRQGKEISSAKWEAALDLEFMLDLVRNGETEKAGAILMERLTDAD